ncbi:TetR/AcrR family transcriptional regulator [Lysobacter sp.]|uniref:TetR/AcrR family transcriptional regulator n=1 Tax=Lysobacter sp. TaxID=72226 RepID=UPI002D453E2A|nr:TetR/AcrR family transcriptional regulator [Lysobacter sp.]HZX76830.1 TetR/AcrR family transcriptional regulator [Lysobacter sp.]
MADRTARKRRQTRDHIAATAHALFERDGYEAVTMEQIAAQADVARGTLYNHFPVKEAVLVHWMHAQLEADLGTLAAEVLSRESFLSRVATLLDVSAQWWEQHRQYAAPYIRFRFQQVRDADEGEPSSGLIPLYARLVADAQKAGELRPDASPERLAFYLHFLYLAAVMTWLGTPGISLAEEFSQALAFFVQGAGQTATAPGGKKRASRRS